MNFLKPRPGNACLLTGAFSFYPDPQSDSRLKALWASLLSAPAHGLPGPKAFQDFPAKGSAVPQNRTMNFLKPGSGNTCFLTGAFSFYPDPQPDSRLKALWASLLSAPARGLPGPKAFRDFPPGQKFCRPPKQDNKLSETSPRKRMPFDGRILFLSRSTARFPP